jgi:hypothetical protein
MLESLLLLLLLGPGAFAIAGVLAYSLGPSPRRMFVVAGLGIPLVLGVFLWAWLESSPTEACHDCSEFWGRWMSPVLVFYLIVNAITWIVGALVGWAIRRARRVNAPMRPLY